MSSAALVPLGADASLGFLIIGSGVRGSKLLASADTLRALPNVEVLALSKSG